MKKILLFFSLLIISALSDAQEYGMGLLYSPEKSAEIPLRAPVLTRDLTFLPSSYSLKPYSPPPMGQGQYGTCAAWSSAYAAMTIANAVAYNWTDSYVIRNEAFSPWYLYYHIKSYSDYNCSRGAYISDAAKFMKNTGLPKKRDYDITCESSISKYDFQKNRIDGYYSLYSYRPTNFMASSTDIQKVKMAISNGHPVIIAAECYSSLSNAQDKWRVSKTVSVVIMPCVWLLTMTTNTVARSLFKIVGEQDGVMVVILGSHTTISNRLYTKPLKYM